MRKVVLSAIAAVGYFLAVGCSISETPAPALFLAFSFEAKLNENNLHVDARSVIGSSSISIAVPPKTDVKKLVATFATNGKEVYVDDARQVSGKTPNDFTDPVDYAIVSKQGRIHRYRVTVAFAAASEDSGFVRSSNPGDRAIFTLEKSSQRIAMIYANNSSNIRFPTKIDDSGTGKLTNRIFLAETELTNSAAAAVLQWGVEKGKFSFDVRAPNGLDRTTVKFGGAKLLDLGSANCRVDYDESGKFVSEAGYEDHPLTNVTWYGAIVLCNWLTEMRDGHTYNAVYTWRNGEHRSKLTPGSQWRVVEEDRTGNGYRLPSSEEWEYAARFRGNDSVNTAKGYKNPFFTKGNSASGATTFYNDHSKGSGEPAKSANDAVAVFGYYGDENGAKSKSTGITDEAKVRSLGPNGANALGIFDMSGNVGEWSISSAGLDRISLGGSWNHAAFFLQTGKSSIPYPPESAAGYLGLRLCRTLD